MNQSKTLEVNGDELDRASEEMADLFRQAGAIFQQPHYQEQASADEMPTPSADPLPTDRTDDKEINQLCPNQT